MLHGFNRLADASAARCIAVTALIYNNGRMKNYRDVSGPTDNKLLTKTKGLSRISGYAGPIADMDIAFQTDAAASRCNASFYDLSMKLVGVEKHGLDEVPSKAKSVLIESLDKVRVENHFASHAKIIDDLDPFNAPKKIYRLRALRGACIHLFEVYYHIDTFAMAVNSARDTEQITSEKAAALIFAADAIFRVFKRALLTPDRAAARRPPLR